MTKTLGTDPKTPADSRLSRRTVVAAMIACAACHRGAASYGAVEPSGPVPPLRSVANVPIGCCVRTDQLADPARAAFLTREFSQLTPEWEMKMGYIVQGNGSYKFDAPDKIMEFATKNGLRVHGTTLAWYKQRPAYFVGLAAQREAFAKAYRDYIVTVVSRYQGGVTGWDVVNEAVMEDGSGLRDCLWSQVLGPDEYMLRAFEHATEADPHAIAFINDYGLERVPAKRATFLKLVERLMKKGAKIGGIGTQTHIRTDQLKGASAAAIRELASLGLPIHVSELDVSLGHFAYPPATLDDKLALQAAQAAEVTEAFMALPERQRYALSIWGAYDKDSWLRMPPFDAMGGDDRPLAFDNQGQPKPMARAIVEGLRGGRAVSRPTT